jgi:hypothetical protein
MFIFRWLKKIIIIVLIVAGALYIADYSYKGKTIREHVKEAYESGLISEGIKDLQTWVVEIFRIGKTAKDGLTENDRAALEDIIKNELKDNVTKLKEEAEKAVSGSEAGKAEKAVQETKTEKK